ncbi:MAG: alpha-2-macroglobulin family protein, partial [Bacteroidota bacterium]
EFTAADAFALEGERLVLLDELAGNVAGATEDDSFGDDGGVDLHVEMDQETTFEEVPMTRQLAPPNPKDKAASQKLQQPTLRKNFKDAIYWNPSLKTDENGIAYAKIQLPDNLTTWRTFAKVITADTEVGQTMTKVVVKKNLLVRLETPRFLKVGDEFLAATTIHNYLPRDKNVTVRLKANGLVVEGSERKIRIPANGEQRLDWKVGAKWALEAKLTVEALTDEESDAKQLKFPVHPHGLEMVVAEATQVRDKAQETLSFTLPEGIDPNTASIELDVSPSIASALLSSMDQLIGYPYGCTEQTMSRFLPNVIVANTITSPWEKNSSIDEEELEKMTAKGLERLAELQHDDGGWGWWENDATHPFFTAHVTNGLFLAEKVGYEVPTQMFVDAKAALRRQIEKETTKEGTTHAYEMRVAVRVGMKDLWEKKRMPKPHLMNAYDKALWLQAATDLGEIKTQKMLLADLEETVVSEGRLAHWGGESFHYRWHDDRVETTANVVQALLQIDTEHPLIAPAVQWLMSQRRGVAWHNTRQTAVTIFALNKLLESELQTDTEVEIFVNGQSIAKEKFDPKSALERGKTYTLRNEKFWVSLTGGVTNKLNVLKVGKNEIRIVQKGKGTAYINARLNYFHDLDRNLPEQKDAPFEVERTYFKLVPKVNKEGNVEYEKKKVDLTKVNSGDVLFVKVKVKTKSTKENVLIEDPIPAGCEFIRDVKPYIIADEPEYDGKQNQRNWWDWEEVWYSHKEFRDQHFAMTITELSAGEYEYSYLMKAELLGTFRVTPAIAQRMYYPEQRGWSEFVEVVIGE